MWTQQRRGAWANCFSVKLCGGVRQSGCTSFWATIEGSVGGGSGHIHWVQLNAKLGWYLLQTLHRVPSSGRGGSVPHLARWYEGGGMRLSRTGQAACAAHVKGGILLDLHTAASDGVLQPTLELVGHLRPWNVGRRSRASCSASAS